MKAASQPAGPLYRAIWRWHFYAGLLTLPFMILLAVTGGIYLFKDEISLRLHRDLLVVTPAVTAPLPAASLVEQALRVAPGELRGYVPPPDAARSARVFIATADAGERDVFVDPYTAQVLGALPRGAFGNLPAMAWVRNLHSLEAAGWMGNRLIEIVAGWALVLVGTGVYLWWPRERGSATRVRGTTRQRVFWRDLHGVIGVFAAGLIAFLAITGLPWSGFWGEGFKHYVNAAGLGAPAGYWSPTTHSGGHAVDLAPLPWTLTGDAHGADAHTGHEHTGHEHTGHEQTGYEQSARAQTGHMHLAHGGPAHATPAFHAPAQPIGLDHALAVFSHHGMPAGYTISMPRDASGVYAASVVPDDVTASRVMHLDQYTGEVLFDAGHADFGVVGRVVEMGTSIHTGQQFGRLNQYLMLLACIATVLLSVTALVAWWKRRPRGKLGAPRYPADYRIPKVILGIAVAVGVLLPLVGASLLLVLAIDLCLPRRRAPA